MKSFLDSIFGHFKKKRREDPVFGSMLYMGDRLKYWEGKAKLPQTASEIEVFVDGLAQDDMEQQHEFFRKLSEDWSNLREEIGPLLAQTLSRWNPRAKNDSVWEQFEPSSITIPKGALESAEWEISFTAQSDGHLFAVRMKGLKPLQVVVG